MFIYQMLGGTITLLVGMAFYIFATGLKKPALHIPAGILTAAGGIQIYASSNSNYVSWLYLWPILFVGLGMAFIFFDQQSNHPTLSWLGRLWCGMGLIFTALVHYLYNLNPAFFNWPMVIIGVGLMFLLPGLPGKLRAFRIPGFLLTGLGALLMLQWLTHNWESWKYVWALLPALVGLGIIAASNENHKAFTAGNIILGVSSILFLVFATVFSGYWYILRYWPVILIILGFWQLIRNNHRKSLSIQHLSQNKKEALE
jgi:hypothetical protein